MSSVWARAREFLAEVYYGISVTILILGLVIYLVTMRFEVSGLIEREREHPTKHELQAVAVKVDDRLDNIERHIEQLDKYGTRALANRTDILEQGQHSQDERIAENVRRMDTLQEALNRLNADLPVIIDRQNSSISAIKELQHRIWSSGGERGPTGPPLR